MTTQVSRTSEVVDARMGPDTSEVGRHNKPQHPPLKQTSDLVACCLYQAIKLSGSKNQAHRSTLSCLRHAMANDHDVGGHLEYFFPFLLSSTPSMSLSLTKFQFRVLSMAPPRSS